MPESRQILAGSGRTGVAGAKMSGRTASSTVVDVTVILQRKKEIPSADLLQHTSMKAHERPVEDHAAFAQRFGSSDESVDAIRALAARFQLTVKHVDAARRVVELSGSAADMERAFGTVLHDFKLGARTYRGRQGPLVLPTEVIPHVEAVLGLDNRPVAKPRLRPRDVQASYYPQQLATFYGFPPYDGTGQTIALIELGGNFGPADLQTYFTASGLAQAPAVTSVSVAPGVPVPYGQDPVSDGEVMLDIEVVGALAPGANIVVYFADNSDQGFYQAVSQAVHDPATTAVSISWGSPEKNWSAQTMSAWDSLGQSATLLNVPIFVAAGDHGCTDEEDSDPGYDGQRHADFPGTCANGVVSCGGTSIRVVNGVLTSESAWNDENGWATGGGVSTNFQLPSWQSGISVDGVTPLQMRGVPDVAAVADPNTGINVRVNGADGVSGGTSAAAPQWAALAAILSQALGRKVGFFLPLLYGGAGAAATNDIVAGNNDVYGVDGYSARPGWDACTGRGSPRGAEILSLLANSASPPAVAPPAGGNGSGANSPGTGGSSATPGPNTPLPTGAPFDPSVAVLCGRFVQAAYTMYRAAPNNLTPAASSDFPAGYRLVAWIQMQDFLLSSLGPAFYGFIAQSAVNSDQFVLAIRGTSNGVEWWDDANAIVKTDFKIQGCGQVGKGFARIYDTLEVIECQTGAAAIAPQRSLRVVGGFAAQVSNLIMRRAGPSARAVGMPPTASIQVTGHSLGAALATLYAMENAQTNPIKKPLLCTFASPLVGDTDFANAFNRLGLISWRIVNEPDLVPKLPPEVLGFRHVDSLQQYSSTGKVKSAPACWHSLATYLSLIDSTLEPDADCSLATVAITPTATLAPSITFPAARTDPIAVNITFNVGTLK